MALDFRWPIGEPWHGYINPWPGPVACMRCDGFGHNDATTLLYRTFSSWAKKVTKKEAEVLLNCGFLPKHIEGLKSESLSPAEEPLLRFSLTEIRARRKNVFGPCDNCDGTGEVPNPHPAVAALYDGVNLYETWEPIDPPKGDGWQLWEDEGLPLSPVHTTAEDLARWCAHAYAEEHPSLPEEGWLQWIASIREPVMTTTASRRAFRLASDRFHVYVESDDVDDGTH